MWDRSYKDYPKDSRMRKIRLESGKGLSGGCEMGDLYGWGNSYQSKRSDVNPGLLKSLVWALFGKGRERDESSS